jgi:hypothetical protein
LSGKNRFLCFFYDTQVLWLVRRLVQRWSGLKRYETGNGQGSTYPCITNGFAGSSSNDVLVQLVGTTATSLAAITVTGGNITAIA